MDNSFSYYYKNKKNLPPVNHQFSKKMPWYKLLFEATIILFLLLPCAIMTMGKNLFESPENLAARKVVFYTSGKSSSFPAIVIGNARPETGKELQMLAIIYLKTNTLKFDSQLSDEEIKKLRLNIKGNKYILSIIEKAKNDPERKVFSVKEEIETKRRKILNSNNKNIELKTIRGCLHEILFV